MTERPFELRDEKMLEAVERATGSDIDFCLVNDHSLVIQQLDATVVLSRVQLWEILDWVFNDSSPVPGE